MYNHIAMAKACDRDLVLQARRGATQAYGELVQRYQASVFGVCLRMMEERQEAEDMTQDAFLRAYQHLDTYDTERPFGPWIRRVAANLCLNRLARSRRAVMPLEDELDQPSESADPGPEALTEIKEQQEIVRAAVLSLPPHYRAVIELRHFQGLRYAEISEVLGIPLSDVKSHLYRARQRLARRLLQDA